MSKRSILKTISEIFFLLSIFPFFISIWSNGWMILRLFLSGVLLMILSYRYEEYLIKKEITEDE